jgi:hypothetical protein
MSDTTTPIDPDTGQPVEEQTPVGGGAESTPPPTAPMPPLPPEDPTPPDAPIGGAAGADSAGAGGEAAQHSLISPDLAGDSLIGGGEEMSPAATVLENDDGSVEL